MQWQFPPLHPLTEMKAPVIRCLLPELAVEELGVELRRAGENPQVMVVLRYRPGAGLSRSFLLMTSGWVELSDATESWLIDLD